MIQNLCRRKRGRNPSVGCLIEALESRRFLNAVTVELPAGGSVLFYATDGTLSRIRFSNCSGSITFEGNNLQNTGTTSRPVILGNISSIGEISVTNATSISAVQVITHSPTEIPFDGPFTADSELKTVDFHVFDLEGDLQGPGISNLFLGSATGATLQVPGEIGTLKVGSASNSTFQIGQGVETFTCGNFATSEFDAMTVGRINATGTWSGNLNIAGNGGTGEVLNSGTFGNVTGGTWNVGGNAWAIGAHSFALGWTGNFGGYISSLKTGADFSGNLTASYIGTASIGGNLNDASIHLTASYSPSTYDLNKMTIGSSAVNSSVWGPGSFNSIHMTYDVGAKFVAGISDINNFNFLGDATQYTSLNAGINSFSNICHAKYNFSDSFVAGGYLGVINAGMVQSSNGGSPFGVNSGSKIQAEIVVLPEGTVGMHINVKDLNATSSVPVTDPGDFRTIIDGTNVM